MNAIVAPNTISIGFQNRWRERLAPLGADAPRGHLAEILTSVVTSDLAWRALVALGDYLQLAIARY